MTDEWEISFAPALNNVLRRKCHSGKQGSLHTSDTPEAIPLIAAKNEAVNNAQLTLAVGKACLAVTDPEMFTRTWFEVTGFVDRREGENIPFHSI